MIGGTPELSSSLCDSLVHGDFHLVYQPEYDIEMSRITAVEALVRWRHPTRGDLEPDAFIAVAEQYNLIGDLGEWVIVNALAEYTEWAAELDLADVVLRLNVSSTHLADPRLVDIFATALARYAVPAGLVCAEITEHPAITDPAAAARTIGALRSLGIHVAMDDFGTGANELSLLRILPVDVLKLDRSLVTGIDGDTRAEAIVTSILDLATALDATVVAEGVETADELKTLRRLGCTRAQGHYLSRPMAGADVLSLLAGRTRRRPAPYPRRRTPGVGRPQPIR